MNPPADIAAALTRLFARTTHGIKPGLERIRALLDRLNHPEREFVALHVAGTNGKGSVCALLESALRAAGYRTGLYTSPHLVRFHERIRVDGLCIRDADLAPLLARLETEAAAVDGQGGSPVTFFELGTALAFEHFRAAGVQVAVIETGMGGRWDATNALRPLVSVITEIGLDHAEYLGPRLADITAEKCGILKPGRPAVCGATDPEVVAQIRAAAASAGCEVTVASEAVSVRRVSASLDGQNIQIETAAGRRLSLTLPLLGAHQLANAAVAAAALEEVAAAGLDVSSKAWKNGWSAVQWPARLQVLEREPPILLDGAHNPQGMQALAAAVDDLRGRAPVGWVGGLMADKDAAGVCRALAPVAARVWTVPVSNPRALAPSDLAAAARAAGLAAEPCDSLASALAAARAWARERGGWVVIAGSLYLAGDVLATCTPGGDLFAAGAAA